MANWQFVLGLCVVWLGTEMGAGEVVGRWGDVARHGWWEEWSHVQLLFPSISKL
jgi:hypothetical protein